MRGVRVLVVGHSNGYCGWYHIVHVREQPSGHSGSAAYPGKISPARRTANPRHHTNKPSTRAPPRSEPGPNQRRVPPSRVRTLRGRPDRRPAAWADARSVGCESRLGAHPRAGRRGSRPAPHGPPRPHCYHSLSNVRRQMIHSLYSSALHISANVLTLARERPCRLSCSRPERAWTGATRAVR